MSIEANPTSYSVLDFLRWQRDGTLDLRPPFQRNAVWRPTLKSSLIDSLLRGYPIPALFLQDRSDTRTFNRRLVVVDGQQRLRTILAYVDIATLKDADERDEFTLMKIHDRTRAGATFADLSQDDKDRIIGSRLNVYVVGATVTDAELLEIFRRMNTFGAKLNAQELRNAEYSGMFKETAYRLSAQSLDHWLSWGIFSRQDVAEMRDAEFTSDLLLLLLDGTAAMTQKRLNDAYKDFETEFDAADGCMKRFMALLSLLDDVYASEDVQRLTTKGWCYSLFDALQQLAYGNTINSGGRRRRRKVDIDAVISASQRINHLIDSGELPDEVARATRGAANDLQSRKVRADYLRGEISA